MTDPTATDPAALRRRDVLYRLVPPVYRALDEAADPSGRLRAFLAVVGEQVNLIEDDLARWYDNWFIETCDDWVVPYLGDLVGYTSAAAERYDPARPEAAVNTAVAYPRREVADTVALRRRKGTLAVLEELSGRLAGWPARAVEFRHLVAGTAAVGRGGDARARAADLRGGAALAALGTAFDSLPRSVDVRRLTSARTPGRHNLPAVALFAARRKVDSTTLAPTAPHGDECLRWFDVRAMDVPLHVRAAAEPRADAIAGRPNLPLPLTRRVLRAKGKKPGEAGASEAYYGFGKSVAVVVRRGDEVELVRPDRILVTDLGGWARPPAGVHPRLVAVDPELGRLAFPADSPPDHVWATFHHGHPADIGGGEYERGPWKEETTFTVAGDDTLAATVDRANALPATTAPVVIEIADNELRNATFHARVPPGGTLVVRAANRYRPCLTAPDEPPQPVERCRFSGGAGGTLVLDGLLFASGTVQVDGEFAEVRIAHCTFVPGRARLVLRANDTAVSFDRCVIGGVHTRRPYGAGGYGEPVTLDVRDSVLDGGPVDPTDATGSPPAAVAGAVRAGHARLSAARCTAFGPVAVGSVGDVEDSLFTHPLTAEDVAAGSVRFTRLPAGSAAPPAYLGGPAAIAAAAADPPPQFVSTAYGHPDYARLADDNPPSVLQGAADGGELGAYHDEFFAQRAAHLRARLDEFVPAGSDAGLIFLT